MTGNDKKKVVLIGSGFSTINFLKTINVNQFDVSVVSPKPFFSISPNLILTAGGSLSPEACLDPIESYTYRDGKQVMEYHEGWAYDFDQDKQELYCVSTQNENFNLKYDYLIVAVGSSVNTFGVPGAKENSHFLKSTENALSIRKHVYETFKKANSLESQTDQENATRIVITGAGPTGVELASELTGLINQEGKRFFKNAQPNMSVHLIEMLPVTLPTYCAGAQEYSQKCLESIGVNVHLNTAVTSVTEDTLTIKKKTSKEETVSELKYGLLIWASGVGPTTFGTKVVEKIGAQKGNRFINVNAKLQVFGASNIFAMGDCSFIKPSKIAELAKELYEDSKNFPEGAGSAFLKMKAEEGLDQKYPQIHSNKYDFSAHPEKTNLSYPDFIEYLNEIDRTYKSPPPTAQTARQFGAYLANNFNEYFPEGIPDYDSMPTFAETFSGRFCYINKDMTLIERPGGILMTGSFGSTWKTAMLNTAMSDATKKAMVMSHMRTRSFGRMTYVPSQN